MLILLSPNRQKSRKKLCILIFFGAYLLPLLLDGVAFGLYTSVL